MKQFTLKEFDRIASEGKASAEAKPGLWRIEKNRYGARKGRLLTSPGGDRPPELVFAAPEPGVYDVYVGTYGPRKQEMDVEFLVGVYARLASQPYYTFFVKEHDEDCYEEHYFLQADLTTDKVCIASFDQESYLDYARLVKVSPQQQEKRRAARALPPKYEVCGICDFPDDAWLSMPDDLEAASAVWRHKQAGFTKIYWRSCAVQCEYHTKIGEVRATTVGDTQIADGTLKARKGKTADSLLKGYDLLRQAVDEAKRCGIAIYGWMRINNEFSKQSHQFSAATKFHREHPDSFQVYKNGDRTPRLSFACPDVRAFKTSLALEIAGYGVDGILIDCLRHPPMEQYEDLVVQPFIAKCGVDPRKEPNDVSEEWLKFRASFFTMFLKQVREGLRAQFGDRVTLAVRCERWLWKCLRDGMDVREWIAQDLIDELVVAPHCPSPAYHPLQMDIRPFAKLCKGKVKLIAQVWRCGSIDTAQSLAKQTAKQGAEGFAFYESNWLLHHSQQRERVRWFRNLK